MYTITVTSTAATNDEGTLPWAIAQANAYTGSGPVVIVVDETLSGQVFALSEPLALTRASHIIAPAEGVTITGGNLRSSADLVLQHLTLPCLELSGTAAYCGEDVTLTSSTPLILTRYSGQADFSGTRAAADSNVVLVNGTLSTAVSTAADFSNCVLRLTEGTEIPAGARPELPSGMKIALDGRTLNIYGSLLAAGMEGNGYVYVKNGGRLEMKNSRISITYGGSLSGSLDVEAGGVLVSSSGDINISDFSMHGVVELRDSYVNCGSTTLYNKAQLTAERTRFTQVLTLNSGSQANISGSTFNSVIIANGTAMLTDNTFERYLQVSNADRISGSGNVFTGRELFRLRDFSGDTAALGTMVSEAPEGAYINVIGTLYSSTLTGRFGTVNAEYRQYMGNTTIAAGHTVTLEEGACLYFEAMPGDRYLYVYGTLKADFETEAPAILSPYRGSFIRVLSGGLLQLRNADISTSYYGDITVHSGGRLEMVGGSIETHTYGISLGIGSSSELRGTKLMNNVLLNSARAVFDGCSFADGLDVRAGSTISLTGNKVRGAVSLSMSATCTAFCGNDFSAATITLTDTAGGRAVDLSGNYWGTTDIDAIIAKIQNYSEERVLINSILLEAPAQVFSFDAAQLGRHSLASGATSLVLSFNRELDVETVTSESIRMLDNRGEEVQITGVDINGREVTLHFAPLSEGSYHVQVVGSVRDIGGNAFTLDGSAGVTFVCAQADAPKVLLFRSNSTVTDQFSYVDIFFDQAMNNDTLTKNSIHITDEAGNALTVNRIYQAGIMGNTFYRVMFDTATTQGTYHVSIDDTAESASGQRLSGGYTREVYVSSPDLVVDEALNISDSRLGRYTTISYTVNNVGNGNINSTTWTDAVYLCRTEEWDESQAVLFGRVTQNRRSLEENGSYTSSVRGLLTDLETGTYYVFVKTDESSRVSEANERNNISATGARVDITPIAHGMGERTETLASANERLYYSFTAENDKGVLFTINDAHADIYVSETGAEQQARENLALSYKTGDQQIASIPTITGKQYSISVRPQSNGTFRSSLEEGHFMLAEASSSMLTAGHQCTIRVYGAAFNDATSFYLIAEDGSTILPVNTQIQSPVSAMLTFDIEKGTPAGTSLILAAKDGTNAAEVRMSKALHIATFSDLLQVNFVQGMNGEQVVSRTGWIWKTDLSVANASPADVSNAIILIDDSEDDFSLYYSYDDANVRDRSALLLLSGAEDSTPRIMTSGESETMGIYVRPYRSLDGELRAFVLSPDENQTISKEWMTKIASALQPAASIQEEWDAWWQRISPRIGTTVADVANFIYSLCDEAVGRGYQVQADLSQLVAFAMQEMPDYMPSYIVSGTICNEEGGHPVGAVVTLSRLQNGIWEEVDSCTVAEDGSYAFYCLKDHNTYAISTGKRWTEGDDEQYKSFTVNGEDISLSGELQTSSVVAGPTQETHFLHLNDGNGTFYRTWIRGGRLMCSVYRNNAWSRPIQISQDEVQDYRFFRSEKDDCYILLWAAADGTLRLRMMKNGKDEQSLLFSDIIVPDSAFLNANNLQHIASTNDGSAVLYFGDLSDSLNVYLVAPLTDFYEEETERLTQRQQEEYTGLGVNDGIFITKSYNFPLGIGGSFRLEGSLKGGYDSPCSYTASGNLSGEASLEIKSFSSEISLEADAVSITYTATANPCTKEVESHFSISVASVTVNVVFENLLIYVLGAVGGVVAGIATSGAAVVPTYKAIVEGLTKLKSLVEKFGAKCIMGVKVSVSFPYYILTSENEDSGNKYQFGFGSIIEIEHKNIDIDFSVNFSIDLVNDEWCNWDISWDGHGKIIFDFLGKTYELGLEREGYGFRFVCYAGYDLNKGTQGGVYDLRSQDTNVFCTLGDTTYRFSVFSEDSISHLTVSTYETATGKLEGPETEIHLQDYLGEIAHADSYFIEHLTSYTGSDSNYALISFTFGESIIAPEDEMDAEDFMAWMEQAEGHAHFATLALRDGRYEALNTSLLESAAAGIRETVFGEFDGVVYLSLLRNHQGCSEIYVSQLESDGSWQSPQLLLATEEHLSELAIFLSPEGPAVSFEWTANAPENGQDAGTHTFTIIRSNDGTWGNATEILTGETFSHITDSQLSNVNLLTEEETAGTGNSIMRSIAYAIEGYLPSPSFPDCKPKNPDDCKQKPDPPTPPTTNLPHKSFQSYDPNDILGPQGYGAQNWVARQEMQFMVECENEAENNIAHAAMVTITQHIDEAFDYSSFRLGNMMIAGQYIEVKGEVQSYKARLDWRSTLGVWVDVNAFFDADTGDVRWEFMALDPETMMVIADPFKGLLAPNFNSPEGEGAVYYYVTPKATAVSGTEMKAEASIVFDFNEAIATPTLNYTLDTDAPVASVKEMAATSTSHYLHVTWEGQDVSSGISRYNIFVSTDGGDWTLWQQNTAGTSALFRVAEGKHTYHFMAQGIDHAGNMEQLSDEVAAEAGTLSHYVPTELRVADISAGQVAGIINFSITFVSEVSCTDWAQALRVTSGDNLLDLNLGTLSYDAATRTLSWQGDAQGVADGQKLQFLLTPGLVSDAKGNAYDGSPSFGAAVELSAVGESYAAPTLYDYNGDGLLDLIVGEKAADGGHVRLYLNEGTAEAPVYTTFVYATTAEDTALTVEAEGCQGAIVRFADMTGDGKDEMLIGLADGSVRVFTAAEGGHWTDAGPLTCDDGDKEASVSVSERAALEFTDFNNDGREDLLIGTGDGYIVLYLNRAENGIRLNGGQYLNDCNGFIRIGSRASVAAGDFDSDGVNDLMVADATGAILFYRNEGSNTEPLFGEAGRVLIGGAAADLSADTTRIRLDAADINHDGKPDLVAGLTDGRILTFYGAEDALLLGTAHAGLIPLPDAPQEVKLTPTGSTLYLTWEATEGEAISYEVSILTEGAAEAEVVTCNGNTLAMPLADGNYTVQVRALNQGHAGAWSAPQRITIDTVAPEAPTSSSFAHSENGISLSWAAVSGADSYDVRYRVAGTETWRTVSVTEPQADITLSANGLYEWQVRAADAVGNSSAWLAGDTFAIGHITTDTEEHWAAGLRFDTAGTLIGGYYDINKSGNGDSELCWAATDANVLAWWQSNSVSGNALHGVPNTVESIYATFSANWYNLSGADVYGLIWWLSGTANSDTYTSYYNRNYRGTSDIGGYYSRYYKPDTIAESTAQVSLKGCDAAAETAAWADIYDKGGMLTLGVFRSVSGGALSGGHSLTLWGYTADAETGHLTELVVTDSDDGKSGISTLSVTYNADTGFYHITGGSNSLAGYALGTYTYLSAFANMPVVTLGTESVVKNGDGTAQVTFRWSAESPAVYVLSVNGKDYNLRGATSYTLTLPESVREYTLTATNAEGNSITLNGTLLYDTKPAHATAIALTNAESGLVIPAGRVKDTIGGGDTQDYYCFTAAEDGTYAIGTDITTPGGSFLLSLGTVDAAGDYVVQRSLTTGKGSTNAIEGINLRKGETAYIRISSEAAAETAYELRVAGEVPAAASITDNNTAATADALVGSAAPAAVQGWVGAGDACDFYRLQLAEASNLQLSLSGVDTAARVKVYAEQADGSRALLSAGTATAVSGLDRTLALTAGSYYIEVAALNPDGGLGNSAYTMELKEQKGKQSTHYMLAAR